MNVAPRNDIQKERERETERRRATFRFVSFMRINNHVFTARGETAKEVLSSESPLGSSSSAFLNFSPLERRSKSGAFFPPSFELVEGPGVRERARARAYMCLWAFVGVCVCACVRPSRVKINLEPLNNNQHKKSPSGVFKKRRHV